MKEEPIQESNIRVDYETAAGNKGLWLKGGQISFLSRLIRVDT